MKLKPTDHIVMFVENNDGIEEFFNDRWAQVICKMTKCDYIFLVDKLDIADANEVINGVIWRYFIYPSDLVEFKKVKSENGMNFKPAIYYIRRTSRPSPR